MQTVLHFLALLLTGFLLQAQNTVAVVMTNFDNNDGKVQVGLYNSAEDFLDKEYKSLRTTIINQQATVTFEDVPDGVYAISCYHDEDNNGRLNMKFGGMIPAEDYACSNGATGFFGPPKWKDAKFEVRKGEVKAIDIKL